MTQWKSDFYSYRLLGNSFNEVCLLEVRLRYRNTLLFGCKYRIPTQTESSDEINEQFFKLIENISAKNYSHVCLVGHFNYRDIYWKTWN